jgi:hypothetical protein
MASSIPALSRWPNSPKPVASRPRGPSRRA